MTFDSTARELESMPTNTKADASTLLSLDGQKVAPEINKGTDATAIGDGGIRGLEPSYIKTAQAVENNRFAATLIQMSMDNMQQAIGRIPAATA